MTPQRIGFHLSLPEEGVGGGEKVGDGPHRVEAARPDAGHGALRHRGGWRLEREPQGDPSHPVEDLLRLVLRHVGGDRDGGHEVGGDPAVGLAHLHPLLAEVLGQGGGTDGGVGVAPAQADPQPRHGHGLRQTLQLSRLEIQILQIHPQVVKSVLRGHFGMEMLLHSASAKEVGEADVVIERLTGCDSS